MREYNRKQFKGWRSSVVETKQYKKYMISRTYSIVSYNYLCYY